MSGEMEYILERIARILLRLEDITGWRWGTITSTTPLRVRLDGDTDALADAPDTLVGGLVVGDRVRAAIDHRRTVIHGRAGGPDIVRILGDTGWVWLVGPIASRSGVRYRIQGTTMTVVADLGTEMNLSITAGGVVVATLPEACWPDEEVVVPASTKGSTTGGQLRIGRDGKITCWAFGGSTPYFAGAAHVPV